MRNKKYITLVAMLFALMAVVPVLAAQEMHGKAKFDVPENLYVEGKALKEGQYNVSYEYTGKEAQVTFKRSGQKNTFTIKGTVQQAAKKYDWDSMAIGKDASGNKTIKELQFSGKTLRIVFD